MLSFFSSGPVPCLLEKQSNFKISQWSLDDFLRVHHAQCNTHLYGYGLERSEKLGKTYWMVIIPFRINLYPDPTTIEVLTRIFTHYYRMSIVNLCLVIFLSLKNTPLSFLTHYTHNTLNVLHRFGM